MSSLEAKRLYYDTNTGLMPIIQALIAPPLTEEDAETERRAKREKKSEKKAEKKEGLDLHPYYKKRGKSHNHDYCDACLEGGNLLCCDTCEASFHLECNDPPLHVDEIPLDTWQCRRCTLLHKESPQKSSPGKSGKRRKSNNSSNSSTSNYKKLKTGHGNDNHFNNNDSGDSDISSVSTTTRRRGRPRKNPLPISPGNSKANSVKGNMSDSDGDATVKENRSKRFLKRRKKDLNSGGSLPRGDGGASTSSDESSNRTEANRERHTPSKTDFGKTRIPTNVTREAAPARMTSAAHIGYMKYSSSDDDDSSDKSLYLGDIVMSGSKGPTEQYLDENTGEIMTRSLCENEYLNKLLSKKNTTSEIDDIEKINELLLKTKNMAMDPNIIKKIIGCSIPEQSESDDNNTYDSDERTSDEEIIIGEEQPLSENKDRTQLSPPNSSNLGLARFLAAVDPSRVISEEAVGKLSTAISSKLSTDISSKLSTEISSKPTEINSTPTEISFKSTKISSKSTIEVSSGSTTNISSKLSTEISSKSTTERSSLLVNSVPVQNNDGPNNTSNVTPCIESSTDVTCTDTMLVKPPSHLPEHSTNNSDSKDLVEWKSEAPSESSTNENSNKPTRSHDSSTLGTNEGSKSGVFENRKNAFQADNTSQIPHKVPAVEKVELVEDDEENRDEELCSLFKFNALWKEKFGTEEARGSEEEGDSESGEEGDDSGDVRLPLLAEQMDVQTKDVAPSLAPSSVLLDLDVDENMELTLEEIDTATELVQLSEDMSSQDVTENDSTQVQDPTTVRVDVNKIIDQCQESTKTQAVNSDQELTRTKVENNIQELSKTCDVRKTQRVEKRAASCQEKEEAERSLDEIEIDWSDKSNELEVRTAMQVLLSAVAHSNPEQFSLGKYEDKSYDKYLWPGTDKIPDNARITSKRVRSLLNLIEVDNDGLVRHPVKICHSCGRTCSKHKPLLGCDYCPLYYHLDCLDPPLTSPPTLTWMCPAHPQHVLDKIVLGGAQGVVERCEAWDAWVSRPVNEQQVTREFLTKVRSQRGSSTMMRRTRVPARIPGIVSHHYQRPPDLIPSLQESLQLEAIRERSTESRSSKEEQEQFLRSLIALQTQLLRLTYETKATPPSEEPADCKSSTSDSAAQTTDQPADVEIKDEKSEILSDEIVLETKPAECKSYRKTSDSAKFTEHKSRNLKLLEPSLSEVRSSDRDGAKIPDSAKISFGKIDLDKPSTVNGDLVTIDLHSQVLSSSQESVDKLDSYFRFGDDFITPPTAVHHESMVPHLSNFKLDDINPNNFKVEDLFITSTDPSDSLLEGSGKSSDDIIELMDEDKNIEEEIVSLNEADVLKDEELMEADNIEAVEEIKQERRIEDDKEKKQETKSEEEKTRTEDSSISTDIVGSKEQVVKEEEKEDDLITLKRKLFVQLSEVMRSCKLPADDKTGAILDLSEIDQLPSDLIQVLALQRLSQLTASDTPTILPPPYLPHPYAPFVPSLSAPRTRLRAQLCPLTRKMSPAPMTSNTMSIGLGASSTLDLSKFGHCSRVSAHHAVIFYEMASNTYELVNLSEHGTRVDAALYSIDTSGSHIRSTPYLPASTPAQKWRSMVTERINEAPFSLDVKGQRLRIREGMERKKKRRRRRGGDEEEEEERIPLHYGENQYKCPCISDPEDSDEEHPSSSSHKASTPKGKQPAWDSTCLVRHGSLLQFGCFKFVFSITDHRHPLPEPYESMMSAHRSQVTDTTDATVESSNAIERKEPVLVGSTGAPTLRSVEASGVLTLGKGTDEKRSEILTSKTVERQQVNSKTSKEFKTSRRKSGGPGGSRKPKRTKSSAAHARDSDSSTDTCSESEDF